MGKRIGGSVQRAILATVAFCAGAVVGAMGWYRPLWVPIMAVREARAALAGREAVPVTHLSGQRVAVLLVLGQSNAANYGGHPAPVRRGIYNWHDGTLYVAREPLLGANGDRGSVWTRLADRLLATHRYDAVVLAPVAQGSERVAAWDEDMPLGQRARQTTRTLVRIGLPPTAVLWWQGESDAADHTDPARYTARLTTLVRDLRAEGVTAPVIIAQATRCQDRGPDAGIRQAQIMAAHTLGALPGPDMDALGLAERYDGCHLTDEGLQVAAGRWLAALVNAL